MSKKKKVQPIEDGLSVKIVSTRGLKNVPEEALHAVMMDILAKQQVKKSFTLLVDAENHSDSYSESTWVKIGGITHSAPGIGIVIRISFVGTDVIWYCRLLIPYAYVPKENNNLFLETIRGIAVELFAKKKTEKNLGAIGGVQTPTSDDVQPEKICEDAWAKVTFPEDRGDEDIVVIDDVRAISGKSKNFKTIFYQAKINLFVKIFVEKADGEHSPLEPEEIFDIFQQMGLDCNFKSALNYLVIDGVVQKPKKARKGPEFIWLTTASKHIHTLQLLNEKGGNAFELIEDLKRVKLLQKIELEALKDDARKASELLALVESNIERRNEALDALLGKKKVSSKTKSTLMEILSECDTCDSKILNLIKKREEK